MSSLFDRPKYTKKQLKKQNRKLRSQNWMLNDAVFYGVKTAGGKFRIPYDRWVRIGDREYFQRASYPKDRALVRKPKK